MVNAAFGARYLEQTGGIDFGFDESAIKDPLKEAAKLGNTKMVTSQAQESSSVSMGKRSLEMLSAERKGGPQSVIGMNREDVDRALNAVRGRVERDYQRHGGGVPKIKCLAALKMVPEHVKRMLRSEYEPRYD